ncbi:maleylpyruvate isomerase N-terminal domain-containing protein [Streptomyces alkaliterrae]|uniref:Maleylpyruvate isomerase N-terminal domain-containing protein n=1 Tax=Streptomyces alkaliterrae TaxID=2213162 RepID=A0A5P0YPX3_9ACTN|nr:maleylpyruvate isomerase N-terminal domain-containing protein [Streptomyces alkaliterrae]MBB1259262.1 maleylpyruvate isomerase N-terminal domain-containing protein [Streptomyces alkaliterrae]MQS02403.1 hypothetical protein [Streptomyces alkaliterrae]
MSVRRQELFEAVEESTHRLLATADRFADGDLAGLSLVPPWTRGHVLSHLARAAESCCRLLHWARTGEPNPTGRWRADVERLPGRAARLVDRADRR